MLKLKLQSWLRSALLFFITTTVSINVVNAEQTSVSSTKNQQINIPFVELEATIDGELDDPIWQHALTLELNIVNSPLNNTQAPVKTEAKIVENGKYIFISFLAHDPNPEKIQASLGDRDTKWFDDIVGIRMDTIGNHRLNYGFFVNPYGVQNDEIYNEMTGEQSDLWDGIWDSYGKITKSGYQVEIALPFHMLNFDPSIKEKKWPFELVRNYPRDIRMRLSHVPLDRNNSCWLCQYPSGVGFKDAQVGKNITVTPAIVANRTENRDIYDSEDDWHSDTEVEPSLDLRWGITPDTILNATINPDFSTVESDAGQLDVNETFSLFYDEKRPFFLENHEYFSSTLNLVYTRNISDPDYGGKLTGTEQSHSYGAFVSQDSETNFILPGNLSSTLASLKTESKNAALRYRYDYDEAFSIGAISTLRNADDYHNYVGGIDTKYKIDDSNWINAQVLTSDTKYPPNLFLDYCYGDCYTPPKTPCKFGSCDYSEQVFRSQKSGSFTDQAYVIEFEHESEFWEAEAEYQQFGEDFRADLGFIPKSDFSEAELSLARIFYNDSDIHNYWQEAKINAEWAIQHNINDELISREVAASIKVDGPKLSLVHIKYIHADRVGLRHDASNLDIDGNTTLFTENLWSVFGQMRPTNKLYISIDALAGDKIDYSNNRLGDYYEVTGNIEWTITPHLTIDVYQTFSEMETNNELVFKANLTDFRLNYQFDVQSYLKLSLVYSDVERNPENNPFSFYTEDEKTLSTQLIYAYKLNPQTVFFLGYSDNSYQDDVLGSLEREERTFFTKFSYAWMP